MGLLGVSNGMGHKDFSRIRRVHGGRRTIETSDYKRLSTLSKIQQFDPTSVRKLFKGLPFTKHAGPMRYTLASELLELYGRNRRKRCVLDPMFGTGMTAIAALHVGFAKFFGAEIVKKWANVATIALERAIAERGGNLIGKSRFYPTMNHADACEVEKIPRAEILLTSPPFPNAHYEGKSEMQTFLRRYKAMHSGTDFECNEVWGCSSCPNKGVWILELRKVLAPWLSALKSSGVALIHVKNFVRHNKEVRVDLWVRKALRAFPSFDCLGYHPVPVGYLSGFQSWRQYPLRNVIDRIETVEGWIDILECGHRKKRLTAKCPVKPKRAHCTVCGPEKGLKTVTEERILVFRKA